MVGRSAECIDLLPIIYYNARQDDDNAFRCRKIKFKYISLPYRQAEHIGLGIEHFRVCPIIEDCLLCLQSGMNKEK